MKSRTSLLILLLGLALAGRSAAPDDPPPCQIHVILFLPAGIEAPPGCHQRIEAIADYAEAFFARELSRWGHKDVVRPIRRSADGRVEIMVIRGKQEIGAYKPVPLRAEVMDELRRQGKVRPRGAAAGDEVSARIDRHVWWILVCAGEAPARFEGFLGGFGEDIGGWATANLDMSDGRIEESEPLGSEFLRKLMLKGMLHELGHGLGLPHIGPLKADDAGNTLMGPTHINYARVAGEGEKRVYLSEAEAAILSMHPAFRGRADDRRALPRVEVQELKYAASREKGQILVRGRVRSPVRAVYALVADESDASPGEYWTKTYVGRVAADGSFAVKVTEPAKSGGTLKTWFIFENGDHTGDGKGRGREGAIARTYAFRGGTWRFE